MLCSRHALAIIHFNSNLKRDVKKINGKYQIKVCYPKFKNGEAVAQNFGKKIVLLP